MHDYEGTDLVPVWLPVTKKEQQMGKKHSDIIIKNQSTSIIEDTYLLAALLTFDPSITYYPKRDGSGNVSFEVTGRIADEMGRFYSGETAPLQTYITNLKRLRSAIFALKNSCRKKVVAVESGSLSE